MAKSEFKKWQIISDPTERTPVFMVSPQNGFLPRADPILLPDQFKELTALLDGMSVALPDGSPGALAKGEFGAQVEKLPMYDVSGIEDQELLMALFRDYTFATSAYLLEPCDIMNRSKGSYGRGRSLLPKQLAVPLQIISEKINAKPFMEYAQSYALYNYKRLDPTQPLDYDNVELIRKFSGSPSEHGFVMIHVAMVRHSPRLVEGVMDAIESAHRHDRIAFNTAMSNILAVMKDINGVMEKMWMKSAPGDYMKFRTFIMGTKGQDEMFPDGVIYEGVDETPRFYRGESGANDSIVPTLDNFLQLTWNMPNNPMTDILRDFRSYRPANHNEWLIWVDQSSQQVQIAEYSELDAVSLCLYIKLLDQVRDFRFRHWLFAKEYIIKRTQHPVATGGSPMATWLPNQLNLVLEMIQQKSKLLQEKYEMIPEVEFIADRAQQQQSGLQKDVKEYVEQFGKAQNSY